MHDCQVRELDHDAGASDMNTRLAEVIGLCALCASALSCANDTGSPKPPAGSSSMFGTAGFVGSMTPPVAGRVGATGGSQGGSDPIGTFPPPVDAMSCRVLAQDSAQGLISEDCSACTCDANAAATAACTGGCWRLLICVSEHCDPTDTNCIVANCADEVGGVVNLANASVLARATPFAQCASKCVPPFAIDDTGPGGDF
jgi:hypothetical protein